MPTFEEIMTYERNKRYKKVREGSQIRSLGRDKVQAEKETERTEERERAGIAELSRSDLYKLAKDKGLDVSWKGSSKEELLELLDGE